MKKTFNLTFVNEFNYPPVVKSHFEEILSHIDISKIESIILTGSTSRGELSYKPANGTISIYSDYEFLLVTKGRVDNLDAKRLSGIYAKLETVFSNTPLFHIDFVYIDKKRFANLPLHLKHYEMRENGKTIFGHDILKYIRQVRPNNLDFKDLNEILIWRLWQILLYMPLALVRGQRPSPDQEEIYNYVICRNFLDLLTWRLPFKGILLPSFGKRYEYLREHFSQWQDDAVIDEDFVDLSGESMKGKFKIQFNRNCIELYADTIRYFIRAKEALTSSSGKIQPYARKLTSNLFHDYHYRRKAHEVLFVSKHLNKMGLFGGFRWLLTKKFSLILEFLCAIHRAVVSNLDGDGVQAFQQLRQAELVLRKLDITITATTDEKPAFPELWQSLRMGFAKFLIDYFPSVRMKTGYINSLLR